MRIGINGSSLIAVGAPISQMIDHAVEAEEAGFASYWMAQLAVPDALTVIAMMGEPHEHDRARHRGHPDVAPPPADAGRRRRSRCRRRSATGSALGIGLAHKISVESTLKIPFATPGQAHGRVPVGAAAGDERAQGVVHRRHLVGRGRGRDGVPGRPAAGRAARRHGPAHAAPRRRAHRRHDPVAQRTEGDRRADQAGPRRRRRRRRAARRRGSSASVPVCVTSKPDEVRNLIATLLAGYNDLPSYRGVMDAEGAGGPADVSIVGTEDEVRAGLAAFADAGTTDFAALEFTTDDDERKATRALLEDIARS